MPRKENIEEKKSFKFNKLFLYICLFKLILLISFHYSKILNNLKMYKFKFILIIRDFFIYFYNEIKHDKTIFLNIFTLIFSGNQT